MKRTGEQVAKALAQLDLNGGNIHQTARETGIPRPTLRLWRNTAIQARSELELPLSAPLKRDFAELWARKEELVLNLIEEKASGASFRDLSIFAGIAADKHLDYTQGRKGTEVNVTQDNRRVNLIVDL